MLEPSVGINLCPNTVIGIKIIVPIAKRKVKIISDKFVSIEQGSGALKVTPAHDFNDFDIGKRHKLEFINIFEKNGKLNNLVPTDLKGLDRFEARNIIIKKLKDLNLLEKIENIKNSVPYGDRSNSIIEPLMTEQWFADAKFLSKKAIEKMFSPEFRNRLDNIITFSGLPQEVVLMVVEKMLVELEVKLQQQKVIINVTDAAKSWLAKTGYDPIFGARPMGRTIQREIETVLADEVLFGKLENGGEVSIGLKKDQLKFKYS